MLAPVKSEKKRIIMGICMHTEWHPMLRRFRHVKRVAATVFQLEKYPTAPITVAEVWAHHLSTIF